MLKTGAPDGPKDTRPHPSLEAQMAGAAGAVFARHHLPLTASAQDIQNAVHDRAVRYAGSPVHARRFVQRQDRFDLCPQVIRYLAESIPLLGFLTHHMVLHDLTMILSVLTNVDRERF